ncbi:hypothetical protein ACFY0B_08555 [Streptomyces sp. NPDC001797]|uniref:Amidohydrolase n=1 Tax=Streptomyces sp. 900105755 TaxID=3154389 RepID=A0ABV1T9H1_9ACTN
MSRILLRGAQVITMTPDRPDAEHVDILVDGVTIAAVGETIEAPDAEVVDFSGRVLLASGLDDVKDQLRESGERLLCSIGPAGSPG